MQRQKATSAESVTFTSYYAQDLTANTYEPIIGRDKELQRLIETLTRKSKANPILVGEPGVGKTKLIHALVNKIKEGSVPPILKDKKVYSIDLSLFGSDIQNIKYVIDEIIESENILFIDEIHNIVGAARQHGSLDVANILKPLLTDTSLKCVGATTPDEFMRYFEKDSALERRFSKVVINEPSVDACLLMLEKSIPSYEKHFGVQINKDTAEACVNLSKRYITDKQLPDKAFDVLDEACAKVSLEKMSKSRVLEQINHYEQEADWEKVSELKYNVLPNSVEGSPLVEVEDIAKTISQRTGIPVSKLKEGDKEKLLKLEDVLKERVIGQDQALESVANQIRTTRVGIKQSNTSMLFLGPTGVGKTETAKTIAEVLFGSENNLVRFDMSEFQEKQSISKLIGTSAGYIGYEDGGQLTEAVRRNPYSVILFDEVEKAHPDVYDTLLHVLDDGILTDNKGRTVNFKNTVIVMTSNLTSDNLKSFFKVEFVNRIDEIINFNTLTKKDIEEITYLKLEKLADTLKQENNILVDFSADIVAKIVDMAYKPEYGARELERVIHKAIEVPLSKKILNNELEENKLFIFTSATNN